MNTTPYWLDTARIRAYPRLNRKLRVDVAVIGAGITGISTAYLLKKAGATVALIEREKCAQMDTGHTTAHLTYVTDERLQDLVRTFGRDHAQAVWDAGKAAIDQIQASVQKESIPCEFAWVPGYLHAALGHNNDKQEIPKLKEDARLASDLGFDATYLDRVPYLNRPGIRFANQAKFHPRKYLAGLLKAIEGGGSHVFEGTQAEEIKEKPLQVTTNGGVIECDFVVIATHVPLQGKTNTISAMLFQSKLALYTSYVLGARLPRGLVPAASFWDTSDPYYYLRIDHYPTHDYAIFGGLDHKTGQARDTRKRFRRLEEMLRKLIPEAKVDHRWSGQVVETNDGLPLIGETASRQFVATGFSGSGMTFGTLAAIMACDAFAGRANPWRDLLSPNRKKVRGGTWNYLRENKDYLYYMLKDRLAKAEARSVRSVKPGQGIILKRKNGKVAAFRDANGKVSVRSAVCPHMGCIVHWNGAEQTWDCPCHGSRFRPTGEVLAGPAEADLAKVE